MDRTSSDKSGNGIVRGIKGAAAVVVLAALGYVAIGAAHHEPKTSVTQASAAATANEPARSATTRDFDYFPDHYVNQATKDEESAPTF